ncbi:hypothetical protein B0H14DRAFT_3513858 [Mycena olivaceomarginata]|nr:hypothetical protein B0H14DRAFT_3513858 [Mycena olivaceomarginata]
MQSQPDYGGVRMGSGLNKDDMRLGSRLDKADPRGGVGHRQNTPGSSTTISQRAWALMWTKTTYKWALVSTKTTCGWGSGLDKADPRVVLDTDKDAGIKRDYFPGEHAMRGLRMSAGRVRGGLLRPDEGSVRMGFDVDKDDVRMGFGLVKDDVRLGSGLDKADPRGGVGHRQSRQGSSATISQVGIM